MPLEAHSSKPIQKGGPAAPGTCSELGENGFKTSRACQGQSTQGNQSVVLGALCISSTNQLTTRCCCCCRSISVLPAPGTRGSGLSLSPPKAWNQLDSMDRLLSLDWNQNTLLRQTLPRTVQMLAALVVQSPGAAAPNGDQKQQ